MNDPIAEMLTKIRNAAAVNLREIEILSSKVKLGIIEILKKEGYIDDYLVEKDGIRDRLKVLLKYNSSGDSALREIRMISRAGRRVYKSYKELKPVKQGMGIIILSTPQGLMTNFKARKNKVGGELICEIF